jgi:hypothetical protein
LAVGCAFVLAVTLLVILEKSQRALELSQIRLHSTESSYLKLKQQFEVLHEYKDRLEKSYMVFKTEKASQFMPNKFTEMELTLAKESHARQIQLLQDDLKACRQRESSRGFTISASPSSSPGNNHKGIEFIQPSHQVPITQSTLLRNSGIGELKSSASGASGVAEELKQHLQIGNGMKDAIQSPIGHVPPVPALPSGDPNEDLAGNVIE